jgi:hypothetical protein
MKLSEINRGMKPFLIRVTLSKDQFIGFGDVIFGVMFKDEFIPAFHEWIAIDGEYKDLALFSCILSTEANLSVVNMGYVKDNKFTMLDVVR